MIDPARRDHRSRRSAAHGSLLALLVVVAVLAGCGGSNDNDGGASASGSTSTQQWADDLCGAVTTWTNALSASAQSLTSGNLTKEDLENAADDARSATQTFADDLKGLGRPDTESGQQAKESLDQLSDELAQDADEIESAVSDVSGTTEVLTAVSSVTATLTKMGSQATSTFDELKQLDTKGELENAFESAGNCGELTSSS